LGFPSAVDRIFRTPPVGMTPHEKGRPHLGGSPDKPPPQGKNSRSEISRSLPGGFHLTFGVESFGWAPPG